MSNPLSSVANFFVNEFLQRVEKLALIQSIQWSSDCNMNNLVFPEHHKQSQNSMVAPSTSATTITITEELLEKTMFNAFVQTKEILSGCEFSILESSEELISFEEVNRIVHKKLTKSKCKISKKKTSASNKVKEEEEEIENEYDDDDNNEEKHQLDKRYSENNTTNEDEKSMLIDELNLDVLPEVSSFTVNGMRIFDSIDNCQNESFFSAESTAQDQSVYNISNLGHEFVPADSSLPPLLTFMTEKWLYCALQCNQRVDCQTFEFDGNSKQCRLWDTGMTIGSIVTSSSNPPSSIGTIQFSTNIYANKHNQSCDKCA
ncbi:unnamed protein product [Rotaria magnacalcarata]|nr:unnamed protein product [Rotaria magnacalcarata]